MFFCFFSLVLFSRDNESSSKDPFWDNKGFSMIDYREDCSMQIGTKGCDHTTLNKPRNSFSFHLFLFILFFFYYAWQRVYSLSVRWQYLTKKYKFFKKTVLRRAKISGAHLNVGKIPIRMLSFLPVAALCNTKQTMAIKIDDAIWIDVNLPASIIRQRLIMFTGLSSLV